MVLQAIEEHWKVNPLDEGNERLLGDWWMGLACHCESLRSYSTATRAWEALSFEKKTISDGAGRVS